MAMSGRTFGADTVIHSIGAIKDAQNAQVAYTENREEVPTNIQYLIACISQHTQGDLHFTFNFDVNIQGKVTLSLLGASSVAA